MDNKKEMVHTSTLLAFFFFFFFSTLVHCSPSSAWLSSSNPSPLLIFLAFLWLGVSADTSSSPRFIFAYLRIRKKELLQKLILFGRKPSATCSCLSTPQRLLPKSTSKRRVDYCMLLLCGSRSWIVSSGVKYASLPDAGHRTVWPGMGFMMSMAN